MDEVPIVIPESTEMTEGMSVIELDNDSMGIQQNVNGTSNISLDTQPSVSRSLSPQEASNETCMFPESPELEVESEGQFTWNLNEYPKLPKKLHSPSFTIGTHSWKLLLYPQGNEPYEDHSVSIYLAVDAGDSATDDWHICAQMIFTVSNPHNDSAVLSKYTQHRFEANESDWGFAQFCPLKALVDEENPLMSHDGGKLAIKVSIRIIKDPLGILWHNFINYNSKKITGFVGLANQGATCYMNSLLQSLFLTNSFKKSIYMIPTENDKPTESNALALQRIFYRLQFSNNPVSTQELTKSFGWDSLEAFVQSDVQEFSRVLLDDLENRTKGTRAEGFIEKLFVGKVRNVIQCMNVPFESKRTESFYDLQLSIKGLSTLEKSFDSYVREEMLEGDNKYHAEGYGLQDAKKFLEFESFPPVLHLHLERYTFDPRVMGTIKINDRLEFPLNINLDKYLADDSPQKGQAQDYILQSVFVHSGDSHGGHYYVYIRDPRSTSDGRWYRFDDTKVIPATQREAVEDNFGGNDADLYGKSAPPAFGTRSMKWDKYKRFTNAYMLVYIRESELESVLCPLDPESDIPGHVGVSIKAEEEVERIRKLERQTQLMTARVSVITEKDVLEHAGFDLYNFENRNQPTSFAWTHRLSRDETLANLKSRFAAQMDVPEERLRFWTFALRHNKTIRLDSPIVDNGKATIGSLVGKTPPRHQHVVLFLEIIPDASESHTLSPDTQLIYFKYFDNTEGVCKPVGKLFVKANETITLYHEALCKMAGHAPDTNLSYFEEVKPNRIDAINPNRSFSDNQFRSGDIICFQVNSINDPKYEPILNVFPYSNKAPYFALGLFLFKIIMVPF